MQPYMGRCLGKKNVKEVPESEAIVGFRVYDFGPKNIKLYSLSFGTSTALKEGAKARCFLYGATIHEPGETPAHDCTCGFYAVDTEKRAQVVGKNFGNKYGGYVIVEVEQWGKCVPHTHGHRSEYIRVRRITEVVMSSYGVRRTPEKVEALQVALRAKYDKV